MIYKNSDNKVADMTRFDILKHHYYGRGEV